MYNKVLKGVIVSISVVFFALVIGYIAYYGTMRYVRSSLAADDGLGGGTAAESVISNAVPETAAPSPFGHYTARLSGDKIEIYSEDDLGKQQFLYSFSVYLPDIPDGDIEVLNRGIRFETREELLKFEEDFTD